MLPRLPLAAVTVAAVAAVVGNTTELLGWVSMLVVAVVAADVFIMAAAMLRDLWRI